MENKEKKYYGQFSPEVDKVLDELYFKNKYDLLSIECGAFDGLTDSCTKFFEENYNWKTINIEPLQNIYNKLIINRPLSINLNIALSNNSDDKIFTNYKHPDLNYEWGNGSLNHTKEHKTYLEELCGKYNYVNTIVKCSTYKKIINDLDIKHVDLFVLDVEGEELNVIDGMIGCNVLPDVFVIEHGHSNTNIFIEKFKEIDFPYKLDHVSFVNSFFIKTK